MLSTPAPGWWRWVIAGILYSDDQGKTWTQAKVPTRQLLTAVFFVDDKHGWAVGHDAQILASADGGADLDKQFEDLKREAPLDVWFQDVNHGLAVGAYGALLETTDGGSTGRTSATAWTTKTSSTSTPSPRSRMPACSSSASRAACSAPGLGPDLGKTPGPLRGSLFGVIGTAQAQTLLAYGLRGNLFAPAISAAPGSRSNSRPRVARWNSACPAPRCSMMARS
jgi:photosystem II stability/assembly factor-like uncharacterized protein